MNYSVLKMFNIGDWLVVLARRMLGWGHERREGSVNTCSWSLLTATQQLSRAMHVVLTNSLINNLTLSRLGETGANLTNPPPGHRDGGLPLISDSLFSLIIMLYVLLAFIFVFFLFCWRRGAPDRPLLDNKVNISHC